MTCHAKPTPGPWIVSDTTNEIDGMDVRSFTVTTREGKVIMDALNSDVIEITSELPTDCDDYTRYYDWQSLANARLMAAAPELYNALSALVDVFEPYEGGDAYAAWTKAKGIIYLTPRDIRGRYLLMERIRRTLTRR